ncbi:pyruvate dehydrogenase complex subunit pdh-e2 [Cystoisospora suis]|uniref:Dihydrolipoamide acetyltransferase component of pyruvate dehydrogenase complex n=1 Tax=Cystoisospora suis TaxID=483139 RepID=A0A2C6KN14_9APIC|nr:pyruvate dehydrogenase complex subunit pdh-e2 [Cystoisospora suis]
MVVESDKADMDVEAFDEGYMASHLVSEGSAARVGSPVALLAEKEEDIPLIQQKGLALLSSSSSPGKGEGDSSSSSLSEKDIFRSELVMPSLSPSMKKGHISVWKKREGEQVRKGEVLFIVESDKADMDVEAPHNGVLERISVKEGVPVAVGSVVGVLASSEGGGGLIKGGEGGEQGGEVLENKARMPEGAREIFMPSLSSTMTSGKISKWNKQVGDPIQMGETLMVVESDKADMDVESFEEGYIAAITLPEGSSAPVGSTVAIVVSTQDDIPKVQEALKHSKQSSLSSSSREEVSSQRKDELASPSSLSPSSFSRKEQEERKREGGGGGSSEAFARHRTQLASWVSPSVDQDVKDQLPEGLTARDLQEEFLHRLSQSKGGSLPQKGKDYLGLGGETKGQDGDGSKMKSAMLERLNLRVPPPHTLLVSDSPPPYLPKAVAMYGREKASMQGGETLQEERRPIARDPTGEPLATFNAVELSKKHKVNLADVKGSGTSGRVTVADVRAHLNLSSEEAKVTIVGEEEKKKEKEGSCLGDVPASGILPFDSMQKAIARNMEATLSVPIFRVSRSIYVDKLESILQELKQMIAEKNDMLLTQQQSQEGSPTMRGGGVRTPEKKNKKIPSVTMSVLLAKAVGMTLANHPIINAAYDPNNGGGIKNPGAINIAMAVSIDGGLVTPVLKNVHKKSIFELSDEWSLLVQKARQRQLTPAEINSGTFYISNLGMFGVKQFDAVLPQGVGSILAVGSTETVLSPAKQKGSPAGVLDGSSSSSLETKRRMTVTITCDHRHIYGSHAAEFLKDLATLLETRPSTLLLPSDAI